MYCLVSPLNKFWDSTVVIEIYFFMQIHYQFAWSFCKELLYSRSWDYKNNFIVITQIAGWFWRSTWNQIYLSVFSHPNLNFRVWHFQLSLFLSVWKSWSITQTWYFNQTKYHVCVILQNEASQNVISLKTLKFSEN